MFAGQTDPGFDDKGYGISFLIFNPLTLTAAKNSLRILIKSYRKQQS